MFYDDSEILSVAAITADTKSHVERQRWNFIKMKIFTRFI